MAVNWKKVPIQIQGLADKSDDKQAVPGTLTTLENAEFTKLNQLSKKAGYENLTTDIYGGGSITNADAFYTLNDEKLILDKHNLYSYSETDNKWIDKGFCSSAYHTLEDAVRAPGAKGLIKAPDFAPLVKSDTVRFEGWDIYGGYVWSSVDGSYLGASGDISAKWVVFDGKLIAVRVTSSYVKIAQVTNPLDAITYTDVTAVGASSSLEDICVSGDYLYVAYYNSTGGQVHLNNFTTSLVAGTPVIALSPANNDTWLVAGSSDDIWIGSQDNTGAPAVLKVRHYNSSLTASFAATTLFTEAGYNAQNFVGYDSGGTLYAYCQMGDFSATIGVEDVKIKSATITTAGSTTASTNWLPNCYIYSHCVPLNGSYGMIVRHYEHFYLVDTSKNVYATIAPGNADAAFPTRVHSLGTDSFVVYISTLQLNSLASWNSSGTSRLTMYADQSIMPEGLVSNDVLYLSGSVAKVYDGTGVVHHGLLSTPQLLSLAATGSGHTGAGSIAGYVTYAMLDAKGNVYESAPVSATVTATANQSIRFEVAENPLIANYGFVKPVTKCYRTAASGTIAYLCAEDFVDGSAKTITDTVYYDSGATKPLSSNPPIYTTGGILSNAQNTPYRKASFYQDRMVISGLEERRRYMVSKPSAPYYIAAFSGDASLFIDELQDDEKVTMVAGHNNQLYIMTENGIRSRSGSFANGAGTGASITEASIVSEGIGLPFSNVTTAITSQPGIMFKSNKGGFYLLAGGLTYVGSDVEDSSSLTITGASNVPGKPQVRFTSSNGDCLVYDYLVQKWSRFVDYSAVGCGNTDGLFTFCASDGVVSRETTTYDENGSFAPMKMVTSWISPAGIAGFQRIRRIYVVGDYKSAHTLRVKVAYDYNSTFTQTSDVTAQTGAPYMYRIDLDTQKCSAIRVSIEDVESTAQGESLNITALLLEVGVKRGGAKLPAAKIGT